MDEEIVQEYCKETSSLLSELNLLLEGIEEEPSNFKNLEVFGQKIDRIMGAAKSLEFHKMGTICESCKIISYKSAQSKSIELVTVVVAFLFDALEVLKELNQSLEQGKAEEINPTSLKTILSRLEFLSSKLVNIQRASVAISDKELLDLSDTFKKLSKS